MRHLLFASLILVLADDARADDMKLQSLDGTVTFSGSYGLTAIKANEFVYQGERKVSQLIWQSRTMSTLNGAVKFELPKDWYMDARATMGLGGDGHMADFDWLKGRKTWSDRSLHPDTRLDHYYVGSLEIGRTVLSQDGTDVGLGAGFKYTDVKWSAWGGSYIYSASGFRNSRGRFDADEKGISYRQSWPVPYLAANLSHQEGAWTFSSALQAGLAINANDIDDHWIRSLRFTDEFDTTPTVSIAGSVDYAIRNNTSLFLGGALDRMLRVRGDTKTVDTLDGKRQLDKNVAGGDFRSATVSFGVKGKF